MWTNNTGTFTKQLFLGFQKFFNIWAKFSKKSVLGQAFKKLEFWDRFQKPKVLGQVLKISSFGKIPILVKKTEPECLLFHKIKLFYHSRW